MKKRKILFLTFCYLLCLICVWTMIVVCHVFFLKETWISWVALFLLILVVDLIVAIFIVDSKKWEQIAKSRWLFVVIFFPVFNFIFLCLFGFNRTKWNNKIDKEVFKICKDKKNNIASFEINQFKFFDNKKQSNLMLYRLILEAKTNIVIQIHKMNLSFFNQKIIPLLLKVKHKNNISIRILYDLNARFPRKILRLLQKNKIEIKCFKPRKIPKIFLNSLLVNSMLLIDNKYAMVSNLLWMESSSNDLFFSFLASGSTLKALLKVFNCYWSMLLTNKKIVFEKLHNFDYSYKTALLDHQMLSQQQYYASYPHTQNIYNILLDLIYKAKKSIKIISNNFLPIDKIRQALETALIKNVDVKIISSANLTKSQKKIWTQFNQIFIINKCHYLIAKKVNYNFIIIDDKYVVLTPLNFNYSSLFLYQQIATCFIDDKKYFTKKFNKILQRSFLTKEVKTSKTSKFLFGWYNIFYPLHI